MKIGINQIRLTAAVCALLGSSSSGALAADDVSRWDGDARSAVRLIAGSPPPRMVPFVRAGIQVRLKSGWHTYWRYPGDSGVPPQFDFSGSQNVKDVHVLWPAPERLSEAGAVSIGYAHDLTMPLHVIPHDLGKPVTLKMKLDYAICEKMCMPAVASAELTLATGPVSQDAALVAAEALVPKMRALGEGEPFAVRSVRRETGPKGPRVVVDVAAPNGMSVTLFAEGPTPQWALPVPEPVNGAPDGIKRFAFDLDGAPPGASYEGALVKLTAVGQEGGIEVAIRLD
jgi:DsbC/DsbD-like thiol-disulfide interchange protein